MYFRRIPEVAPLWTLRQSAGRGRFRELKLPIKLSRQEIRWGGKLQKKTLKCSKSLSLFWHSCLSTGIPNWDISTPDSWSQPKQLPTPGKSSPLKHVFGSLRRRFFQRTSPVLPCWHVVIARSHEIFPKILLLTRYPHPSCFRRRGYFLTIPSTFRVWYCP